MYIFILSYPIFIVAIFSALHIMDKYTFVVYLKRGSLFSILPLPLVALALRIGRASIVSRIGTEVFLYYFFDTTIVPLLLFLYMLYVLLNSINSINSIRTEFMQGTGIIESAICSSLYSYMIISLAHIVVNGAFTNWIDILVIPLIRMAMLQTLVYITISLGGNFLGIVNKKYRYVLAVLYFIVFILLGTVGTEAILFGLYASYKTSLIAMGVVLLIATISTLRLARYRYTR